jgi:hypothetical protein
MGEAEIVYSNAQRMAWMVDDIGSGVRGYHLLCKELAEADGSEGVERRGGVRRIGARIANTRSCWLCQVGYGGEQGIHTMRIGHCGGVVR